MQNNIFTNSTGITSNKDLQTTYAAHMLCQLNHLHVHSESFIQKSVFKRELTDKEQYVILLLNKPLLE